MTESLPQYLSLCGFESLLEALKRRGYTLVGPRVRHGAIVYDELEGVGELPRGVTERQSPGHYELLSSADRGGRPGETVRGVLHGSRMFGFSSTAQSFKRFFHPPKQRLYSIRKGPRGPELRPGETGARKLALIGARGCDVAGLQVLDGVLARPGTEDRGYAERRSDVFVLGVHCAVAGATCFCSSMGTGPQLDRGYDLALGELSEGKAGEEAPCFVVEVGSPLGQEVLAEVPSRQASTAEVEAVRRQGEDTRGQIQRRVKTEGLRERLQRQAESPLWDQVAERCLACTNCTMVCPTCFCSNTEDQEELGGEIRRERSWDSCFTGDFSFLHGGSVRGSTKARYRQWLTHKFSTWFDQFGSSGCVGCGRCITWCPVGIDVTEELARHADAEAASSGSPEPTVVAPAAPSPTSPSPTGERSDED